jgi:hypothetical protein
LTASEQQVAPVRRREPLKMASAMNVLLSPLYHGGALTWDEYLLILIGLIVLIVIAVTGGKPPKKPSASGEKQQGKP